MSGGAHTVMINAAKSVGLTGAALTTAVAAALAENATADPTKTHRNNDGSTDYGLWQINSVHGYPVSQLLTPLGNAQAMDAISKHGTDWSPWATYPAKVQAQLPNAELKIKQSTDDGSIIGDVVGGAADVVDPFGVIPGHGSPASSLIPDSVGGAFKAIGNLTSHLLDSKWWLRIGQGLAAVILLLVALGLIFRREIIRGGMDAATDGLSETLPKGK
jgi:hypothetical protein